MFVVSLMFAAAMAAPTQTFVQRLVNAGYGQRKTVTAGALPPGWQSPVPLPQSIPLLGSVKTAGESDELYYNPADAHAAAQAYISQLRADGFVERSGIRGPFASGTFSPFAQVLCRGDQGVSVSAPAPDDLRVNVMEHTPFSGCSSNSHVPSTPLPTLLAPSNSVLQVVNGGNIMSYPGRSSTTSTATITSNLSARALLQAFARQFLSAGWEAQKPFASPQGAAQEFSYVRKQTRWQADLVIARAGESNTYMAYVLANGTPQMGAASNVAAARPALTYHASDESAMMRLAKRLIAPMAPPDGVVDVYPGRLPAAFTADAPLPKGSLVGSVVSKNDVSLYYDVTRGQYEAFLAALSAAGYTASDVVPHAGGFELDSIAGTTSFCKPNAPNVNVSLVNKTNALDLHIAAQPAASCGASRFPRPLAFSPLPPLRAPSDARLQPVFPASVPLGSSGASVVTSLPLADLLASFASQMTNADWTASAPLANDAIGTQTFTSTRNGTQWQAVLTVHRSHNDPKTYYAYIDVTRL